MTGLRREADELRRLLLTDDVTGLGNERAWDEAERQPVVAVIEIDGVRSTLGKGMNLTLNRVVGQALRETDAEVHRIGTNLCYAQARNEFALRSELDAAAARLEATWLDGTTEFHVERAPRLATVAWAAASGQTRSRLECGAT